MNELNIFTRQFQGRPFVKMHGLLNHFVITDARRHAWQPGVAEIVRICDVRCGVGADQLIIIEQPRDAGLAAAAVAFMRILNVDGREVEACGNATRCVAWLLLEELACDALVLETLAGLIECRRVGDRVVSCSMGRIRTEWQAIPLAEERDALSLDLSFGPLSNPVALNIGNPHLVYFVDDLDAVDIEKYAPKIQRHPLFPEQVNVGIAEMVAADRIKLVVYERGAGLTTACGSGACVAAFAAIHRQLTDQRELVVELPAGEVGIEITDNGSAIMTGPVAFCFSGVL